MQHAGPTKPSRGAVKIRLGPRQQGSRLSEGLVESYAAQTPKQSQEAFCLPVDKQPVHC